MSPIMRFVSQRSSSFRPAGDLIEVLVPNDTHNSAGDQGPVRPIATSEAEESVNVAIPSENRSKLAMSEPLATNESLPVFKSAGARWVLYAKAWTRQSYKAREGKQMSMTRRQLELEMKLSRGTVDKIVKRAESKHDTVCIEFKAPQGDFDRNWTASCRIRRRGHGPYKEVVTLSPPMIQTLESLYKEM